MKVKTALLIIGGLFLLLVIGVITAFIIDTSNDVAYDVIKKEDRGDSYKMSVSTDATSEDELKTIVEEVKKENKEIGMDAGWLFISDKEENLLAKAKIPYNKKGRKMIGAYNSNPDYLIEMK